MDTFFIRPACPGADIRDQATGDRLPDDGTTKPRDPYWIGLEIRGDVIAGEAGIPASTDQPPEPEPPVAPKADKKA